MGSEGHPGNKHILKKIHKLPRAHTLHQATFVYHFFNPAIEFEFNAINGMQFTMVTIDCILIYLR